MPWLRWWDREGNLLPTGNERAAQEQLRADKAELQLQQEKENLQQEKERSQKLADRLRELGIDPNNLS